MSPLIVETLLMTGLLVLAVLVLRGPVGAVFGARAAYALWLAPLARMAWALVPALPSDMSAGPAIATAPTLIAVTLEPAARAAATLPGWVLPIWLGGATLYLGWRLTAHQLFLRRALRSGRPILGRTAADLIATPSVDGPLATGLVHPLILVPDDFDSRFTPEQQRLALAHEELHHRRRDLWALSAALLLTALNWFNPLAHLALAAFRRDMEAACDAQLLAEGRGERADYAETLLRCAARPVPRSLCALTAIDELKGRLTMLANTPSLARRLAGTGLALGLAAAGLTLALPAAAEPTTLTGTFTGMRVTADGAATGNFQEKAGPVTKKEIRIVEIGNGDKMTDGKRVELERMAVDRKCPDGTEAISAETGGQKNAEGKVEKVRIMICTKGAATKAESVAGLEKALARIQADAEMKPEIKAEISAKLQARIAEMKAN